jgi:hypothetical protein
MASGTYFHTDNKEIPEWQHFTLGEPESVGCYSPGILTLLTQIEQINASRLIIVGICCELYISFPTNTGTELMERAAEISASFARLQTELEGLLTTVQRAAKAANQKNTTTPGSKP